MSLELIVITFFAIMMVYLLILGFLSILGVTRTKSKKRYKSCGDVWESDRMEGCFNRKTSARCSDTSSYTGGYSSCSSTDSSSFED